MKTLLVAGALVAFAGSALAGDEPFPRRFKPDQFPQVVELIEAGMQAGGEFEAKPEVQEQVRTLLTQIGNLLEGNERLADLDALEKDAIEKRRGLINGLLSGKEGRHVADTDARDKKPRSRHDMLEKRTTDRTTAVDSVY